MPRSLTEILQGVSAAQELLERLGGGGGPDGLDGEPVSGAIFDRAYVGEIRNEDELVIGIGEPEAFALDTQDFPLTDAWRAIAAFISMTENAGLQADAPRGRLRVTVMWEPDAEE